MDLKGKFSELKKRGEGGLIVYVTGGDPDPELTPSIVEAAVEGGADIIEIGIPFSDPIADGPTIQASSVRALRAGVTPKMVVEMAGEVKEQLNVPVILLSYYNPIFRMGVERFFELAEANGVDGVIVPDLPFEEAGEYRKFAKAHGVDTIFLAAPSTPSERLKRIIEFTSGFLYLVSVFGVTGVRERVQRLTIETVSRVKRFTENVIPLAVGFGLSKPEHVRLVLECGADAAIVGSAFIKIIEGAKEVLMKVEEYARKLKEATRNVNRMRGVPRAGASQY